MQDYITRQAGEIPQPKLQISVDKLARYEKVAETPVDLQSRGRKKIGFVNNNLIQKRHRCPANYSCSII
jgi:biopolymer transport protein ExbD